MSWCLITSIGNLEKDPWFPWRLELCRYKLLSSLFSLWQVYSLWDSLGTCHLPTSWSFSTKFYLSLYLRIKRVCKIGLMGDGAGNALFSPGHRRYWAAFSSRSLLGRTEVWSVCGHPALHITVLKDVNIFLGKRTLSDLSICPSSWFPCPNFPKQHPQSLSIGSYFSPRNAFILHDILCICFLFSVPFPHSIQPHRHLEYKLHETKDCFIYCHFLELDSAENMGHSCWVNGWEALLNAASSVYLSHECLCLHCVCSEERVYKKITPIPRLK